MVVRMGDGVLAELDEVVTHDESRFRVNGDGQPQQVRYRRILLKLSGEALMGSPTSSSRTTPTHPPSPPGATNPFAGTASNERPKLCRRQTSPSTLHKPAPSWD